MPSTTQLVPTLLLLVAAAVLVVLVRRLRRGGWSQTIYSWQQGLLYVDGRFAGRLAPGRYRALGRRDRLVVALSRLPVFETLHAVEVTSADRLSYRLSATVVYEIVDPQTAHEGGHREAVRVAATDALVRLAAARTVEALLDERASLGPSLLALLDRPVCGCRFVEATVGGVTLPPELRRLFAETERARLEGRAALERARGEQAALRSLANSARMLKGNPELMNLRLLQSLSASGGKGATLVIGREAFATSGIAEPAEERDP